AGHQPPEGGLAPDRLVEGRRLGHGPHDAGRGRRRAARNDPPEHDDPEKSGGVRTAVDWLSLAMWSAPPMVPFEELQRTFAARYPASDPLDLGQGTVGVLPSLSFPPAELRKIVGIGYYEERLLFLLLLLRRPQVKVVYLTSMPVEEAGVDYYLSFLPDPAGARSRLHMLAAGDPAPRSLTAKLLDRPGLLDRVRELCEGPGGAFVQPFNVTASEQELAEGLRAP